MTTIPMISVYSGTVPNKATQTAIEFADNVYPYMKFYDVTRVPQMQSYSVALNTLSTEIQQSALQVSIDKEETLASKDESISAKNEAVLAKNEIKGYVIPTEATYSPQTIQAKIAMDAILTTTGAR